MSVSVFLCHCHFNKISTTQSYEWLRLSLVPELNLLLRRLQIQWSTVKKVKLLSRVQLFAAPWTVAYQAPLSMGFSRQEYWSRFPFPSPGDLPNPGIEPWSPTSQADTLTSELPGSTVNFHLLSWGLIQDLKTRCKLLSWVLSEKVYYWVMWYFFQFFQGSSILLSKMAVSIYISTKSARGFPFLHTLSSIYYLYILWWWPFWLVWGDILYFSIQSMSLVDRT